MDKKQRALGWKIPEDEVLCKAWVMVGTDPAYGSDMSDKTFWQKINLYYESNRPVGSICRDQSSYNSRFKRIKKECMLYSAALRKAEAVHASGECNTDVVLQAESNYFAEVNRPWTLKHCWTILQNEPNFQTQTPPLFGTPINLYVDDTPSSESGPSSSARPMGQKAVRKGKQKKDNSKAMEEYLSFVKAQEVEAKEIRAQEFAMLREDSWMQVDPSIFTPNTKMFWERRQKPIKDREMANEPLSSSQPSSNTARNLFGEPQSTSWIPLDEE